MKTYARVDNGVVMEFIDAAVDEEGNEVPIENRFTPDIVATLVDVTDATPAPSLGWTYLEGIFAAPIPYQPSAAEIFASNSRERDRLLGVAGLAIAPLQDALDLDVIEPAEQTLLTQWKQYRVAVNRVDLTIQSPVWPPPPVSPSYAEANPLA